MHLIILEFVELIYYISLFFKIRHALAAFNDQFLENDRLSIFIRNGPLREGGRNAAPHFPLHRFKYVIPVHSKFEQDLQPLVYPSLANPRAVTNVNFFGSDCIIKITFQFPSRTFI